MGNDKNCNTCRYHDEGMCYCPKSEEFRDVTVNTYCCGQYERSWKKAMVEAFMKGGGKMSDESKTPKKPQAVLSVFGGTAYECRNCGDEVQKYLPYCPWCGQMQDWSDVDES